MTFIHHNLKLIVAALVGLALSLLPRLVWSQDVDAGLSEGAGLLPDWAPALLLIGAALFAGFLCIFLLKRQPPSREQF